MMRNRFIALLIIAAAIFNSCSTEIDVAAPYKEIPVIWGLLSKDDSVHYIKVNKAFLVEDGSAIVAAAVPDSSLFPYELSVKLYALNQNGTGFIDSVTLDTTRIPKAEGIFQSNDLVYKTPKYKLRNYSTLSRDTLWCNYRLVVRRKSDGKLIAQATTSIVGDFRQRMPTGDLRFYEPSFNPGVRYVTTPCQWSTPRNGRMYNAKVRFRFKIANDLDTTLNGFDSLEFGIFNGARTSITNGSGEINYFFAGESFYRFLQTNLGSLPAAEFRREYYAPVEFRFEFAGVDLGQYLEITNNTISLSDVKPEYTNIQGGYGIFSSRMRKVFYKNLDLKSIAELEEGCITGRRAPNCVDCNDPAGDFRTECGGEDLGFR